MKDPLAEALSQLTSVLDELGIRFALVGSLASSAHGAFRATADGDVLARIQPEQARQLAAALGRQWYAETETIEGSIRSGRSFNVIHIPTAQKIDLFPAVSKFHNEQLERAVPIDVFPPPDQVQLPVASVEDMVLAKLQWYRAGGEVSERQWSDVVGLLEQNPSLDFGYVDRWAPELGVQNLFSRALAEAGRDRSGEAQTL